jgi:hypothetical protein
LPPSTINTAPLPDSKVNIPVTIDLTSTFNQFNSTIQSDFSGGANINGSLRYKWSVHRFPFVLSLKPNWTHRCRCQCTLQR